MTASNTPAISSLSKGTRLDVFTVREGKKDGKGFWVRTGSAWVNQDGSINITLDVLPLDGKLTIRHPRPDSEA